MSFSVHPFRPNDAEAWDDFCAGSLQATLLHTRRFLSYHGERFADQSLIVQEDGKWVGLFPAARSPVAATHVVSHPGITYGGVIHQGGLKGERMVVALAAICRSYAAQACTRLTYKAVPTFYHQAPAQDDLYALFRLGARRTRCDLSSLIDLQHRLPVSERRRRSLKKAIRAKVAIVAGIPHLADLWEVLTDNLARKHDTRPVHSLAEIALLAERFPDHIRCICGTVGGRVVAGTVLFMTPTTYHTQYIAASETGHEVSALDLVFEHCMAAAQQNGKRWFDFGISTEQGGSVLNDGLYRFKSEFGAGGAVHEFFELDLQGEHHVD